MKQFSDITTDEENDLMNALQDAAIKWAEDNDFGGLSTARYNFYVAIQQAIAAECKTARYGVDPRKHH